MTDTEKNRFALENAALKAVVAATRDVRVGRAVVIAPPAPAHEVLREIAAAELTRAAGVDEKTAAELVDDAAVRLGIAGRFAGQPIHLRVPPLEYNPDDALARAVAAAQESIADARKELVRRAEAGLREARGKILDALSDDLKPPEAPE